MYWNLYLSKICVFLLLIVCRLVSGLSPLFISRKVKKNSDFIRTSKQWVEKCVSYSMDFSGGILLATIFIHMIPEVREHLSEELGDKYVFPFAETLVCIGFFIVYVLEELVKLVLLDKNQLHEKGNVMNPIPESEQRILSFKNESDSNGGECHDLEQVTSIRKPNNEVKSMIREESNKNNNNTRNEIKNSLKHLLLVSALSFHSVMEGLAIGLATNEKDLWYLFLAVMLHECTIILCVGIELVANCSSLSTVIKYIIVLTMVSPAGVIIGAVITILVSNTGNSALNMNVIYILQGLAAGTILYVTFFEVLNNHKHHHSHPHDGRQQHHDHHFESGLSKLIFIAVGFGFMICLELITSEHHSHGSSTRICNITS